MSLAIDTFKSALTGGGARPNLFKVTIPGLGVGEQGAGSLVLCKGAALPASVIGQIDVPFRGRQFKVAGDRTFENWTVTVFNDTSFKIRAALEAWMNTINGHASGEGNPDPNAYQRDLTVEQLGRDNTTLRSYVIYSAFPVNLGAIDLSYDSNDAVQEYTVEFAYQYWIGDGNGGMVG
jgi:hypothetical protein